MGAAEELLIKIKTVESLGGFDALEGKVKQAQTDMKAMESSTNASSKKMKTDLEQVNNTNFNNLNNKFKATITSMSSTAASGAKAIKNSLEGMVDGVDGAITSVTAGMGVMDLFEKSMSKALTTTQLKNAKPNDYNTIMDQYQRFTTASSASDEDINKMLRFTFQGNSNETYKALNAVDAISYSADKLQRAEGIRGWGTYLSGGWSAASGMMRDEPLTADQTKLLQGAKTYDERVAAMETIAKQKGNVDKFGNSLSTTVDGPLGKYNQTLAAQDAIVRGATTSFETLMSWISPVIAGFMALDPSVQGTIGTVLTAGIVVTAVGAGLGILSKLLSPVGSTAMSVVSKLKSALSGADGVKDGVKTVKDALSGGKLTSTVNIKAATVNVNGKLTGTGTGDITGTGGKNGGKNTGTGGKSGNAGGLLALLGLSSGDIGAVAAGIAFPAIASGQAWFDKGNTGLNSFQDLRSQYLAADVDSVLGMFTGSNSTVAQDAANRGNSWIKGKGITTGNQPGIFDWLTGNKPSNNMNVPGILDLPWGSIGNALTDPMAFLTGISGTSGGPYLSQKLFGGLFNPVSATSSGSSGHPSFQQDLAGLFDFSRFGITWPNIDAQGWADTNLKKPVEDGWNNARNIVMSNPIIGGAITAVTNLFKDPQKAWNDARNYVSHSIIGQAWANAKALYDNVVNWWNAARNYVKTVPIIGQVYQYVTGDTGKNAAGDNADLGYGTGPYYEPVITPSTKTTKTTKQTIIHAPITIESISNREEGDRAITAVTNHLNQFNNDNGN